jgi:hypothetical protein
LFKELRVQTKDGLRWLTKRERQFAISYYYKPQNTKSASQPANHYMRYSDIKSTNSKNNNASASLILNDQAALTNSTRSAVNNQNNANNSSGQQQLSQQKQQALLNGRIVYKDLVEDLNEWKFHYVISQINNLMDDENESLQEINDMYDLINAYENNKKTGKNSSGEATNVTKSKAASKDISFATNAKTSALSDMVFKVTEALKVTFFLDSLSFSLNF